MAETKLARVLRAGRARLAEKALGELIMGACVCAQETAGTGALDGLWYDERTAAPGKEAAVRDAVHLLTERDLLDRHPEHPAWVRVWVWVEEGDDDGAT